MADESRQEIKGRIQGMPAERWRQINDLLDDVLDLPPDAGSSHLDVHSDGDPELRREIEALLASLEEATGFLEEPAVPRGGADPPPEPASLAGERVGAYRIVEKIGEGGMAAVYLAERDDVRKRVALKVVGGGLTSPAHVERFLFERRLLARLEHPNIARLLDAGVTEHGVPYFAMEYVDGQSIDEYCDARRLTVGARLELFQTVCRVVQYAHQNQVVHRDLKPSNILVTADGDVRLLDFGIAKLLEEDPAEPALATRTGLRPMTPAYASPEQILGRPVTTASDVYSLGVLLYELLTGRHPHATTVSGRLESLLAEGEPERPSTAVTRSSGSATEDAGSASLAQARSTSADRLRRSLSGDIDAVCLKTLRSDPAHRYQSAEGLHEDVQRHLAGLPVTARKDTTGYLLGKFVRRHRLGVAASFLVALSLLAGIVATTWQAHLAAAERDRAEQVAAVLPELFWSLEPVGAQQTAVTPEQMLDRGLERIETRLAGQGEIQARVLTLACDLYMRLAAYDKAEQAARRALDLRRQLGDEETSGVAASMAMLAQSLDKQARFDESEPLHVEALAIRRRILGNEHLDVATSLHNYAMLHDDKGALERAEELYREALAIRLRLHAGDHRDVAFTQTNLAIDLYYQQDYEEAEHLVRDALAMRRRLFGDIHADVAHGLHNLAAILYAKGERKEAEELYRETLAILRQVHGEEHPFVSFALSRLALIASDRSEYGEAEDLLRQALTIQRQAYGEVHPQVALTRSRLGECLTVQERYEEAEPLLIGGLDGLRGAFGTRDARTQDALRRLAGFHEAQGRPEAAAAYRAQIIE